MKKKVLFAAAFMLAIEACGMYVDREDVVPPGNLVERLVKLVLLILAIDTVLLRNLLFVSHLYLQDT